MNLSDCQVRFFGNGPVFFPACKNHGKNPLENIPFGRFYGGLKVAKKMPAKNRKKQQFSLTFLASPVKLSLIKIYNPFYLLSNSKGDYERWIFRHCITAS
jgi:hypothetical protein